MYYAANYQLVLYYHSSYDARMDHGIDTTKVYPVSTAIAAEARLQGMDAYKAMYNASIKNPEEFWRQVSHTSNINERK